MRSLHEVGFVLLLAMSCTGTALSATDGESGSIIAPATAFMNLEQMSTPSQPSAPVPPPKPLVVSIGRAQDLLGKPMFADRRTSLSSISEVRFSDRPIVTSRSRAGGLYGSSTLSGARISSGYGYRYHPLSGGWKRHAGVDLALPAGTPVYASSSGSVVRASWAGGYGLLVELDHGKGMQTRYAHLSRVAVRAGQSIVQGELIGFVGSTGRSTGAHLHYETRVNGAAVDPIDF